MPSKLLRFFSLDSMTTSHVVEKQGESKSPRFVSRNDINIITTDNNIKKLFETCGIILLVLMQYCKKLIFSIPCFIVRRKHESINFPGTDSDLDKSLAAESANGILKISLDVNSIVHIINDADDNLLVKMAFQTLKHVVSV